MFQLLFSQGTSFFALLIASPRFFSGAISLGVLSQIANAFERVNEALSWFIGSYTIFAAWRATADRLTEFAAEIKREAETAVHGARREMCPQETIDLREVGVSLPDGAPLLAPVTLKLKPHEPVLLRGPSGAGKSTLFRVLAGLWPFATGHIRLPVGAKTLFLPQRPYIPIGTLREALWYPTPPPLGGEALERAALAAVGLSAMIERSNEDPLWAQALSLGEQQRLAIASAVLLKPDWLCLDEATSATDEAEETALYRMLADALPATTIVSIGHRGSLEAYHRRVITIDRPIGGPGRLVDQADDPLGATRLLRVQ
jgi:putative ATP-binding cassette transporter